jgi:hypothetical protein
MVRPVRHEAVTIEVYSVVADILQPVAPGIQHVQEGPRRRVDPTVAQCPSHGPAVVDNQPDMTARRGAGAITLLQDQELAGEIEIGVRRGRAP